MKFIVFLFSVLLFFEYTPQSKDVIFYKGKKYGLDTFPLERYFEKHPNKRPKSDIITSANWKGYKGVFEIRDDKFWVKAVLIDLEDTLNTNKYVYKSVADEIFPSSKLADWFTGLLEINLLYIIDQPKKNSDHIILRILKGEIVETRLMTDLEYQSFKKKQAINFMKSKEFKFLMKNRFSNRYDDRGVIETIKYKIIDFTTKFYD